MFKNLLEIEGIKLLKKEDQQLVFGGSCSIAQCESACEVAGKLGQTNDVEGCKADCKTICT